jgi:hypothetical protein
MNDHTVHDHDHRDHDLTPDAAPGGDRHTIVDERVSVEPVAVTTERKMSVRSFVAGFLAAVVAAAIALVVFLAVTDADDDGEIELDVPAVDVDVDG